MAPHSMYIGSGSIFSTADDMETWRHHLFAGDIINADELTELLAFEPTSRYSYGLEKNHYITELDDDVWTHTGWVPGYTSVCGFDTIWGSVTVLNNDEKNFDILIPLLDVIYLRNEPVDAGIETILSPVSNSCMASTTPEVLLKNYGVEPLTSVSINYQLNGGSVNTYNWSGNLMTDETAIVALSPITPLTGLNTLWVYTSNPNGGDDNRIGNAGARSQFINNTGSTGLTSLDEDFEGTEFPPAGWLNGEIETHTWARSGLSLLSGTGCAVKANWFDFTSRTYDLELPMVDLTALDKPELSFDYAYAYAGQGWEDELEILVSTDCGESYHSVFHKSGQGLKTALELDLFFPEDAEWKNQKINLSAYKNDDLLIIFRATSSNGNHLYIDNVKVDEKAPNNQRIKGDNSVELEIYPNPVNDIATVSFELKSSQVVVARVFDLNGRLVTTLSEGRFEAGEHQLEWNSQGETSGMYILKVEVGEQVWMEKLSVLH